MTISKRKVSLVDILRILVYVVALLCCVVLTITGFFPVLVQGEHISGYLLMIHATFAPVFAACLAVLAVMWASRCRFTYADWPWFQRFVQWISSPADSAGEETAGDKPCLGQKVAFWLIVLLALPLILSILLSMFPLLGTHWQKYLQGMHLYVAAVFVPVVLAHTFLLIRAVKR